MTWGNPIVNGAGARLRLRQSEILELRKFWVADVPPSMTESRCLGIAARIIRKRYPQIRCLVTYCEAKEKASAYKGAGWLLLSTSTHANQMTSSNGKVISFRDFTRRGGKKVLGENWTPNKVSKGKWILPLDPSIAAVVQRQDAHLPGGKRRIVTDPAAFIHGDVKEPELTLDPKRFSDCPDLL